MDDRIGCLSRETRERLLCGYDSHATLEQGEYQCSLVSCFGRELGELAPSILDVNPLEAEQKVASFQSCVETGFKTLLSQRGRSSYWNPIRTEHESMQSMQIESIQYPWSLLELYGNPQSDIRDFNFSQKSTCFLRWTSGWPFCRRNKDQPTTRSWELATVGGPTSEQSR